MGKSWMALAVNAITVLPLPVQRNGSDPIVQTASFARTSGTFTVPARTVAVLEQR